MSKFTSFKSTRFGEYLYAGNKEYNSERRYVLTWCEKGDPTTDPDMRWEIEEFGDYVGIKSVRFDEWLYAGNPKLERNKRHVLTWKKAGDPKSDPDMRWKIVDFGDYVGIQSVRFGEWVYAGNPKLDSERRRVLTYVTGDPTSDSDMRWIREDHGAAGPPIAIISIGWKQIGTLPAGRETSTAIKVGVIQMDSDKQTNSTSFTNTFEISASYAHPAGATGGAKNSTTLALANIAETMSSTTLTYEETTEETWKVSDKDQKVWGLTVTGENGFTYVNKKFLRTGDNKPDEPNLADILW